MKKRKQDKPFCFCEAQSMLVDRRKESREGRIKYKIVGDGYEVTEDFVYKSPRYNRTITIKKGFFSDGATKAIDVDSNAWFIHDHICRYAVWDDGAPIDNWTASTVLSDELHKDGFTFRCHSWWIATYLFGGGAARKNGFRRVKNA